MANRAVEVGCDLELVEPRSCAFAADYFTADEQALISRTPVANQPLVLALLWSAKESALKAMRVGLRADTRSVAVEIPALCPVDSHMWRPLLVCHSTGERHGWWRVADEMVRTVVAVPWPQRPEFLRMSDSPPAGD